MNTLFKTLGRLAAASALISFSACADDDGSSAPNTNDAATNSADLPSQVKCKGDICEIAAPATNPIAKDLTLTADKKWLLKGGVLIGDDKTKTVLTIEAGTTVYGETSTKAFVAIRRHSQIMAVGTRDKPIVFTSSQPVGDRARGDWGGVVINGNATINGCDAAKSAAGCEAEGEGGTGKYGGADDKDNSGVIKYVRVEFAGHPITEDNELNGIALQGVGSGTTIEHLQIHMAADDGIEFFGGTASFKYVLTTGVSDDNLDWTDGWRGKGQFFVAQQYEDAGDNGIEADNNGDANDATPRSNPMLENLTLIGVETSSKSDMGLLLREGTGASITNAVVIGWNDACLDIDHKATYDNAMQGGKMTGGLVIKNSVFACKAPYETDDEKDKAGNKKKDPWSLKDFIEKHNTGNEVGDAKTLLEKPFETTSPDFRPVKGSKAASGGLKAADSFFTPVTFRGAVDPADDWTKGWTTSARK